MELITSPYWSMVTKNGHHIPACFTQLVLADNPYITGIILGDGVVYAGPAWAEPDYDVDIPPVYTHDDICQFQENAEMQEDVDRGLEHIGESMETYHSRLKSIIIGHVV
jgi:hypothetical protein